MVLTVVVVDVVIHAAEVQERIYAVFFVANDVLKAEGMVLNCSKWKTLQQLKMIWIQS